MNGPFQRNLLFTLLLIAVATITLAVGVQFYAAHESDRASLLRDQSLVENGMAGLIAEVGRRPVALTSWDEAVLNLDNQFSLEWAKSNVAKYLAETENFEAAIVLDREDRPIYAMRSGQTIEIETTGELQRVAAALVTRARNVEAQRGPAGSVFARGNKMADPIIFSAINRVGSELFILSAMVVQPDFGTALPHADRSAIVVTADILDAGFVSAFAGRFLLADAHLVDGIAPPKPDHAYVGLRDSENTVVATLEWSPPTPGDALLRKSLPATLLVVLCLGTIAWRLYQKLSRAAQALAQSQSKLSAVIDYALDGMISIDERGTIEHFNPACERMFGYAASEALGRNIKMLMPEPYRHEHDGYLTRYLTTGEARIIGTAGREVSGKRKDGSVFPLDLSISAFRLEDGRHFSGILRDVTVRKEVQERKALLAAIVSSSEDAIISKTLDGIITSWNGSAERLFGYTAEEAIGLHIALIIPPERISEERLLLERLTRGEQIQQFRTERVNKGGRRIPISLSISPLQDSRGCIVGASKIARDISREKEAEADALRYTRDLERSNRELDDFAYIASHDLKEPLRGLTSNATFLQHDYASKLDASAITRLDRMSYLCQRMERLIDDLLHFSYLGKQKLAIGLTDLNAVIADIQSVTEPASFERKVTINIPVTLPAIVCDEPRVTELFRNLIGNAVKYNDAEMKIVEIGCIDTRNDATGIGEQTFYVRDNGIGIQEQFHEEIFRIFKRLNQEQDDKKGTGVGLTFVRKIVHRHGGRIWLKSRAGEGTTFFFTLAAEAGD